jgi:acyl dehydratase
MTRVHHFIKAPRSVELYARAAAGAVLPSQVWGGGSTLPDQILEQWDIRLAGSRVDAYCDVTGFPPGQGLPDTFPSMLGFGLGLRLMTDRGFPLKALGMVHIYDRIDVLRPLGRDETLSVSVSARNLRPHRKGALVDLVADVSSRGELVWTEVSTYLSRGSKAAGKAEPAEQEVIPGVPEEGSFEVIAVPEDVGRRFAGVSGDRNPIHLHAVSARAFGFPRAIAHGRWTMARSLASVAGAYPYPAQIQTWFRAPVKLPSTCLLAMSESEGGTQVWLSDPDRSTIHVYTRISAGLDDPTGPARP